MGQLLIIFSNMVLKELFLSAALVMYLIFKFPSQVMFVDGCNPLCACHCNVTAFIHIIAY